MVFALSGSRLRKIKEAPDEGVGGRAGKASNITATVKKK